MPQITIFYADAGIFLRPYSKQSLNVDGNEIRSIWLDSESDTVRIIDQRKLPHRLVIERIDSIATMVRAIKDKHVRGVDLLFMTGVYGVFLAAKRAPASEYRFFVDRAAEKLQRAAPDSFGLSAGIKCQLKAIRAGDSQRDQIMLAREAASGFAEENIAQCKKIGEHGLSLLNRFHRKRKSDEIINILTTGNSGALAAVDTGTVTAPIFAAHSAGMRVHVWISESRPRFEGARLTAWEFEQEGVDYTVVPDTTTGYLLRNGQVDLVVEGAHMLRPDGTILGNSGAYLTALASADNSVPYYVALTSRAIDWDGTGCEDTGPVNHNDDEGVRFAKGLLGTTEQSVLVSPRSSRTLQISQDSVRPQLITGLITEKGICRSSAEDLIALFPEKRRLSAA